MNIPSRACYARVARVALALIAWLSIAAPLAAQEKEPPAKELSLGDVIDQSADAIVQIVAQSSTGQSVTLGSGFVVDAKGLVATNYHVLRGRRDLAVQFRDKQKYRVTGMRAVNKEGDLAVLELEKKPEKLRVLVLAPQTPPRQGDNVIAIGHPHGLSFTVTAGIVSAVRKTSELPEEVSGMISAPQDQLWVQTSAPISPGNSGGPLLDGRGRVVGINTWIADGQNLGFAVHASHLQALLENPSKELLPLPAGGSAKDLEQLFAAPEERVTELMRDYQNAEREFAIQLRAERDEQAARKLYETDHPGPKFAPRFLEVAEAERGSVVAAQSLMLACRLDASSKQGKHIRRALDRLLEDHADDRWLAAELSTLLQTQHAAVTDFLCKLADKSQDKQVCGVCCYLAAYSLSQDPQKSEEAVRYLERCVKDYKDVKAGEATLGEAAEPLLFKIKFLAVGKQAPEIRGKDVEGKEFKLSEYRGKVVLLDFFADWCPHCVRMYPHERKMLEQYAGKPFTILGVNCDSKDTLRDIIRDKKVTWRCWANGQEGPIARQWQVSGFPLLYLLDHEGVIRQVYNGRPDEAELDKLVAELVAKATESDKQPEPKKP